jgi:hypothetical protein
MLVQDVAFFPSLLSLLFPGVDAMNPWIHVPVLSLLGLAAVLGMHWTLRGMIRLMRGIGRPFWIGVAALSLLGVPAILTTETTVTGLLVRQFQADTTNVVLAAAETPPASRQSAVSPTPTSTPPPDPPAHAVARKARFTRLGSRNVLFFIVESYGYTAYNKPGVAEAVRAEADLREAALRRAGYTVRSSYLVSPVIGGWSWLADATLLTGLHIDSQREYDTLLDSDIASIPKLFHRAGYRTVQAAPGTVHGEWEDVRTFYGFQEEVLGWEYGFEGPMFSFVFVTDQFAVRTIHDRYVAVDAAEPLFAQYILVSSHGPFNRIPPYVADWSRLGDGSIYHELPALEFDNNWISGEEYDEGYREAIRYELETLTGYLTKFIEDESLIVIVGDHQPKYPITPREYPLSVPVHLISRDAELLRPLDAKGFVEGLIPTQEPPHPPMKDFFQAFFEVVGTPMTATSAGTADSAGDTLQ